MQAGAAVTVVTGADFEVEGAVDPREKKICILFANLNPNLGIKQSFFPRKRPLFMGLAIM